MNELSLLQQSLDQKHQTLFGYCLPGETLELLCIRLVAEGIVEKPSFREARFMGKDASAAIKTKRNIYIGETISVPIYDGNKIGYGNEISEPAIIEEAFTTILLTSGYNLICDKYNNYLIYSKEMGLEESFRQVRKDSGK